MNKTAFVISAVLTAFLLAIAGGAVYTARACAKCQCCPKVRNMLAEQASTEPQPTAGLDPQTAQEIQQREATYQNLIAQANERLLQAQQKQQELQSQLAALQTVTDNAAQALAPVQVAPRRLPKLQHST